MDFDEEQEEEIGMHQMDAEVNFQPMGGGDEAPADAVAGGRKNGGVGSGGAAAIRYRYRECLKNHAVGIGGHAVDGCGEFLPAGDDGTLDALKCAACGCHRNFHRKEEEDGHLHHVTPYSYRTPHHHHHHPSGYLHVTPQRPLAALASNSRDDDMSNPSSSGGGEGVGGGSKKRFRTKFTQEQRDKMLAFAERLEWCIQKQDEEAVQQFCADNNVRRQVFKVWMHNNKHTLGKKP